MKRIAEHDPTVGDNTVLNDYLLFSVFMKVTLSSQALWLEHIYHIGRLYLTKKNDDIQIKHHVQGKNREDGGVICAVIILLHHLNSMSRLMIVGGVGEISSTLLQHH